MQMREELNCDKSDRPSGSDQNNFMGPDVIQRFNSLGIVPPPCAPGVGLQHQQANNQHTIVRAQLHQIPKHLQHMTRPLQVMSPIQLRVLVREKILSEGIRLSSIPYTSPKVSPI